MKTNRLILSAICGAAVLFSFASCKPIEPETPAQEEKDDEEIIISIDPADIVVGDPEYGELSDNL